MPSTGNKHTVTFISTHTYVRISVTYFQFHFPLIACFYTAVEVKYITCNFRLSILNCSQRINSKHTVNVNELGIYVSPVSYRFRMCIICMIDCKGTEITSNKHMYIKNNTDTQFHILVEISVFQLSNFMSN